MMTKYINPFTDFGFKKLFGEDSSQELLLDFLNALLEDETGEIKSLKYLKKDQLGENAILRKAIYDLYCENEKGEKFIIEIQQAKFKYFKDRMIYYSSFPMQEQSKIGNWDFNFKAIYVVGIMDFSIDENMDYRSDICLMNKKTNAVFSDKLNFICLEMPKFNKTLDELETKFDKWLYVLKNLTRLDDIPNKLRESIFEKFFHEAKIANLTGVELEKYQIDTKASLDSINTYRSYEDKGREEGEQKKALEVARKMLSKNIDKETIVEITGLSIEEIERLKK